MAAYDATHHTTLIHIRFCAMFVAAVENHPRPSRAAISQPSEF
jgi:hypothetical protein